MIRKHICFLFVLASVWSFWPQNCSYAEVRAMWVTRFQMDSQKKIDRFIKDARSNGFNTVVVQVLGRGVAYYDSKLIPKYDFGFDPLAYTVEKSHNSGLKVIAWLNAYYVWSSEKAPAFKDHVVNLHPDWVITDGKMKYLNPSFEPVKSYLYDIYLEVAKKYAVDGMHFDYIRYPNEYLGFDPQSRRNFSNSYWLDPALLVNDPGLVKEYYGLRGFNKLKEKWSEYRSDQVTDLVARIYKGIRAVNSSMEVSAAVHADSDSARDEKGQDWALWLKKGIIDKVYPMIYSSDFNRVNKLIRRSASKSGNSRIVIGLGAYKNSSRDLIRQIKLYRYYEYRFPSLAGICLFSYDALTDDSVYLPAVKQYAF